MYLCSIAHAKPKSWSRWLPMAEWWYNTVHHSSMNMIPYRELYGKDPPSVNFHQYVRHKNANLDNFCQQRAKMQVILKSNLSKAQERMSYYANKHRLEWQFEKGDDIFPKLQAFRQNSIKDTRDNKFVPKYYGPYQIVKKIGSVSYQLQLPLKIKIHNTFHISLLKKKIGEHVMVSSDLPVVIKEKV